MEDTIAAISTPPGEGAVALIRISGPQAFFIFEKIFYATHGMKKVIPRFATVGAIRENGQTVDQVLATVFRSPASYTGEDMVEIGCHGGILLSAYVLELILKAGARAAEPGEFTQRAFLNGKLDLTRAEAVMDIIRARTPLALRAAAEQLQGRLGDEVAALRTAILEIVAHVEAFIDFPDEGISPATGLALQQKISSVVTRVDKLLATAHEGRVLREGVRVAIAGKPNAGKSSLLNCLLGVERAIVSAVPGTTRDTIEEIACLRGIVFRLTDTAGIRETQDPIEYEGVERALCAIHQADLVLHLVDASFIDVDTASYEREILVINKCDLLTSESKFPPHAVKISALTGEGIPALVDMMIRETCGQHLTAGQSLAAINARHKVLLEQALHALKESQGLLQVGDPVELIAVELRAALDAVGQIIGAIDTEDILGEIFSSFCIGK